MNSTKKDELFIRKTYQYLLAQTYEGEKQVFRADDYVKVSDLAEAYELCQKRSSLVVGGMVWMKMTHITKRTIVDLSGLDWMQSKKKEGEFSIGCMCSLRQLETHEGLNRYFDGIFRECTRNIVGVQMRNCATVGGSIFCPFRIFRYTDLLSGTGYLCGAVS